MGAAALINHSRALSTSEVGLNFGPDAGSTGAFGPGWWHQPGLKGALVPVGFTNRDQCLCYISKHFAKFQNLIASCPRRRRPSSTPPGCSTSPSPPPPRPSPSRTRAVLVATPTVAIVVASRPRCEPPRRPGSVFFIFISLIFFVHIYIYI